ncbi:sialate O-acetylesterase [Larkinella soli]|uniref:sialate O-acetylesterase n=1 Tax=Larkinella soli TaxID=1770527 RepID=UPI000FFB3CA1|nr:sialate O-acetylesterase [Larkinella soli]
MKFTVSGRLLSVALLLLCCYSAFAQIKITYPATRAIFQRDQANSSNINIAGTYAVPVTRIEARLVKMSEGQGNDTDWQTVQDQPKGGVFQGVIRGTGGWYRLEVRGWDGSTLVGQDNVLRVGIGEVFIITGQSNAQGFQQKGAEGAADDRVNCITYDNSVTNSLENPPSPSFRQLGADALVGPRGQSAWCWGILGDMIVQRYQVPVLFINTAWEGTAIHNWVESANGQITKNVFADRFFPQGMPYGNLLIALRYFSALQGLRAVLWQQGETDNHIRARQTEYYNNMQYLINKTRADSKRYTAWMLARSSYNLGRLDPGIIAAQNQVINTFNNNVWAGPETDKIQIPRYDAVNGDGGTHFGGEGLRQVAEAWFASMNERFFSGAIPLLPLPAPTLTVSCATTNQAVNLSLPTEVRDYRGDVYPLTNITWSNGQKGNTLTVSTPGTYYAIAKDPEGTTFISPSINVTAPLLPTAPNIIPSGQQQACADSSFTFSTDSPAVNSVVWSNNVNSRKLTTGTAGTYTARSVNVYGCTSPPSASVSLIVRPKVLPPTVETQGPFSLRATLPANAPAGQTTFEWKSGTRLLSGSGSLVKVTQSGSYAARAKTVFTLGTNSLTCYSEYSKEALYVSNETAENGLVVYPNPSADGLVRIEIREDLVNAEVTVTTLSGQVAYRTKIGTFNFPLTLNLAALSTGNYIVQVRADGYKATRRVWIK